MFERVIDYGLTGDCEKKILSFLDRIYQTDFNSPEVWEKEIFEFFSQELIVPYVVEVTLKDEDEFLDEIKEVFFPGREGMVYICDTNELYKSLIKIRESVKAGMDLKKFIPFFFENNFFIRKVTIKKEDTEDERFSKYSWGIHRRSWDRIFEGKLVGTENFYLIVPDYNLLYPVDILADGIIEDFRKKLRDLAKGKKAVKKNRKPIDSRLRHEVFKRDNYKCLECGATNKDSMLHADHIIPVAQGGSDELSNLQTLCDKCNLAKSDKCFVGGQNEC